MIQFNPALGRFYADGKFIGNFDPLAGAYTDVFREELARRVNGWEALVAFVKSRVGDCSCMTTRTGYCETCQAYEALRKAGCDE